MSVSTHDQEIRVDLDRIGQEGFPDVAAGWRSLEASVDAVPREMLLQGSAVITLGRAARHLRDRDVFGPLEQGMASPRALAAGALPSQAMSAFPRDAGPGRI